MRRQSKTYQLHALFYSSVIILFWMIGSLMLFSCQTDEDKDIRGGKQQEWKDPRFLMSYYDGAYDVYNFCEAPFVHPDTIEQRIVDGGEYEPHKVLATIEHKALIDRVIKDWDINSNTYYPNDSFGLFDDSLTAVFRLGGKNAFPNKAEEKRYLKGVGADLSMRYSAIPGFRSVQVLNPPVAMRAYLLYLKGPIAFEYKNVAQKEVTNEAYLVTFDPRVAIVRGGLGEKGRNLKLVRRKLTKMTAEDFRWLNADFFIDVPAKDKGRFYGMKLEIVCQDGRKVQGYTSFPIDREPVVGGIIYPGMKEEPSNEPPREEFYYGSSIPWFLYHNRQPKKQ